jgi:hypothetical protein
VFELHQLFGDFLLVAHNLLESHFDPSFRLLGNLAANL